MDQEAVIQDDISQEKRAELLNSFGIDAATCTTLHTLRPVVEANIDHVLQEVVKFIEAVPELKEKLPDQWELQQILEKMKIHFGNMFSGDFNEAYFQETARIGQVHARVQLTPRWYMAAYALVCELVIGAVIKDALANWREHRKRLIMSSATIESLLNSIQTKLTAAVKAFLLDMNLSLNVYFEENLEQKKENMLNREAITAISDTFSKVASGDLRVHLQDEIGQTSPMLVKNFKSLISGLTDLVVGIKDTASLVENSASRVKRQSSEVEQYNQKQSTTIAKTSESMGRLDQSMGEIAEREKELEKQMQTCLQHVAYGNDNMGAMRKTMDDIREAWSSVAESISVIRRIAAQTNILALNASVEAARAGDAGKGFAVVANAIRDLSQKTTHAAEEIVQNSTSNERLIGNGIKGISNTLNSFQKAGEEIQLVSEVSNKIAHDILSRRKDFASITEQCASLADIAQQTSSSVELAKEEALELDNTAKKLNGQTKRFKS